MFRVIGWLVACVLTAGLPTDAFAQAAQAGEDVAEGQDPAEVTALPPDEPKAEAPPPETPFLEQSSLFLERTHLGVRAPFMRHPDPAGSILFEASPALHVFVWNPLSRYTAIRPGRAGHATMPVAVSLTFNPEMRMLAQDSEPVRSPSWKIRGNLQLFHKYPQRHALKLEMTGLRLSFGHYSNGQEGCSFESDRLESEGCAHFDYEGRRGPPDLSLVNRASGDFSLNQTTLAVHHRFITLQQLAPGRQMRRHMREHRSHTFGLVADYIESRGVGGISPQLRSLYGSFALQGEYRFETLGAIRLLDITARFAAEASAQARFGTGEGVYPLRLHGELSYTIPAWSDLGLFVSFFRGQDYYNLQFVDKVDYQLLFGVVVDLYPRPRHACIAETDAGCRVK